MTKKKHLKNKKSESGMMIKNMFAMSAFVICANVTVAIPVIFWFPELYIIPMVMGIASIVTILLTAFTALTVSIGRT